MALDQAEWIAYFTDTSEFEYVYSGNLVNYGGFANLSSYSTFFEVY